MKKFIVVNPWEKGQKAGDVFMTKNLHPVLRNHVIAAADQVAEAKDNSELLAALAAKDLVIAELEAKLEAKAAEPEAKDTVATTAPKGKAEAAKPGDAAWAPKK